MITIEGGGDDIVFAAGHTKNGQTAREEFYTYEPPPLVWHAELFAPGGDCLDVTALQIDGAWQFAVGSPMGEMPFPDWPVRIVPGRAPYSPRVEIDAPDGTRLDNVWPGQ